MPCTPFTVGGARGFICSRTPRPRCGCGQSATIQCDAPKPPKLISGGPNAGRVRKAGTCDKHLCASCATEVGPDRHLCQAHAAEQRQREENEPTPMEPWQAGLF